MDNSCFARRAGAFDYALDNDKAALRGAMVALKGPLEPWERKEFEGVRRRAIKGIITRVRSLRLARRCSF